MYCVIPFQIKCNIAFHRKPACRQLFSDCQLKLETLVHTNEPLRSTYFLSSLKECLLATYFITLIRRKLAWIHLAAPAKKALQNVLLVGKIQVGDMHFFVKLNSSYLILPCKFIFVSSKCTLKLSVAKSHKRRRTETPTLALGICEFD